MRACLFLGLLSFVSCNFGVPVVSLNNPPPPDGGGGSDEIPLKVNLRCPGTGCEDVGDGKLYAGVAKHDITPLVEPFTDTNHNGVWDMGEPYEDRNGNGQFDAYWIAGFGNGRLAYDVHDPVWARAIALRYNKTTVVLVTVDTLGLFRDETKAVQALLDPSLNISLLMIHGTHCHETADMTGGWGATSLDYGVNEAYQQQVRHGIAAAVTGALSALQPARATFSSIAVEDGPMHDMTRYVSDTRDPVVIDNVLNTIQFSVPPAPNMPAVPIATIVNWAHHPETAGSQNHSISSDFIYYLREYLEEHGAGMALYVSGAVGGQIGPGRVVPLDPDGQPVQSAGFAKSEAIGKEVAHFATMAMADPNAVTVPPEQLKIQFRDTLFNVHVNNRVFQLAAQLMIYRRAFTGYDTTRPLGDDNVPLIETHVAYLQLGPAAILTNPGELLPELLIGGYDGKYAGTYPFIDMTKPNSPDVTKAPQPPYLIDIMDGDRRFRQTWGLTLDFLGYIVPRYNFVVDADNPYLVEAKGDHYEETNSVGPLAEPEIVGTMRQLVLDGRQP